MATARFSFRTEHKSTYVMNPEPRHSKEFIFELTDDKLIKHARALLAGTASHEGHVGGRIVHKKADYNPAFSFHLDPSTIYFFDTEIEVRDAEPEYVEDHIDDAGGAFLPGKQWAPWASRIIREIKI
ncbi:calmodulin [Streptomyces sp. CA-251247]|uniref:BP74-related protein n=1 Tax=Streptomyces sp. CA-251247 TaxID=3240062 RepID=UPI003D8C7639